MVLTVMKTSFDKHKGKEIFYRDYKNFDRNVFKEDLQSALASSEISNYKSFEKIFLVNFDKHAPIKKKLPESKSCSIYEQNSEISYHEKVTTRK